MLQLPYLLTSILFASHTALTHPSLQPTLNTPSSPWPELPYTTTFGNLQLTIHTYGRPATPPLNWEILLDLDNLRRQILNTSDRFPNDQITLYSDIVAISVIFHDSSVVGRISRKEVANVITAFKADVARWGGREIGRGIVGVERHRSGVFVEVAEIRVAFARVDGGE